MSSQSRLADQSRLAESRSRRVLVIDDDADTRQLLRAILENEGMEVRDAESAERIEGAIQFFAPDLILCDVLMPGRDGLEVCRSLHADASTGSIPVVLVSSKAFDGDKREALDAGAAGYVVKPFTPVQLLSAVRDALSVQTRLTIWGCRGSIPTPERASGRYGGNTSCVDLALPGNRRLVFDAGTGIRALGHAIAGQSPMRIALCLTHFHWDHIFGLPFFTPLYVPANEIHIHGPGDSNDALSEKIHTEMGGDYFPVSIESFRSLVKFIGLREQSFKALDVPIATFYALHPCRTLAYRVELDGRSVVYAPDNEILPESVTPELSGEALRLALFCSGASLLIHDCTYSRQTYEKRRGWGHSSPDTLAAVAAHARVERVLLFHHDPDSSDEDVEAIHREFEAAMESLGENIPGEPAREGSTLYL